MLNTFKIAITLLALTACISVDVNAPEIDQPIEHPTVSITMPTVQTTLPTIEPTTPTEPIYELIDIPPIPELPDISAFKTIYDVEDAIAVCNTVLSEYEALIETLSPDHPQYNDIFQLKTALLDTIDEYQAVLDEHWQSREEKRPVMTYIWRALKEYGYSDAVTAGIIGNLLAETGGMGYQDIEWDIKANGYYGICMWSLKYVPSIDGASLDEQIGYLVSSVEREMNHVYSKSLRRKFDVLNLRYADFLELDSPYDVAIAFGVCYERPSAKHIKRRGPLGEKAYDYYINLNSWPWPGQ